MSASELDEFYVHTLTVATYRGTNGYGEDVYAAPFTIAPPLGCMIEPKRRLVRDQNGAEVVSETTIYTYPTHTARFVPGSRVTVGTDVATVITVAVFETGDLDLPDHIVVNLDRGASRSQ